MKAALTEASHADLWDRLLGPLVGLCRFMFVYVGLCLCPVPRFGVLSQRVVTEEAEGRGASDDE